MIRHAGKVASGVTVEFVYQDGAVQCVIHGEICSFPRGQVMRKYRRVRYEFLQRVAGALGHEVAVFEVDEAGNPTGFYPVSEPTAGRA